MANYFVYNKRTEKGDRSLINHMYNLSWLFPGFMFERDGLKDSLKEPGVDEPLSLTIKNTDGNRLVAAIPEDDPFKVMLFDESAFRFITEMVEGLFSMQRVLIEIQ